MILVNPFMSFITAGGGTPPTLRGTSAGYKATTGTSHPVPLPVTCNAGDVITLFVTTYDHSNTITISATGFTQLTDAFNDSAGSQRTRQTIITKVAAGGETSITVTASGSVYLLAIPVVTTTASGSTIAGGTNIGTATNGTDAVTLGSIAYAANTMTFVAVSGYNSGPDNDFTGYTQVLGTNLDNTFNVFYRSNATSGSTGSISGTLGAASEWITAGVVVASATSGTLSIPFEGEAFPTNNTAVTVNAVGSNGVVTNDWVVVWAAADLTYISTPTAAGGGAFTNTVTNNANAQTEGRWYHKQLAGGDTTISLPGDPNFNGKRYQYWFVHSTTTVALDGSNQLIAQGTDAGGTNTTATWDSVTPTQDNCLVLIAESNRASGTTYSGLPGGYTVDQTNPTGYYSCWAGHLTQTTATATGAITITNSGAAFGRWVAGIFVLKAT